MTEVTYLDLKWSVSRGRETYGYNVLTLTDTTTGKRYRCSGGGYDMKGTVFADWLVDVYEGEIARKLMGREGAIYNGGTVLRNDADDTLYGLVLVVDDASFARPSIDGACGFGSVRAIAEALGFDVLSRDHDRNGNARGYLVVRAS